MANPSQLMQGMTVARQNADVPMFGMIRNQDWQQLGLPANTGSNAARMQYRYDNAGNIRSMTPDATGMNWTVGDVFMPQSEVQQRLSGGFSGGAPNLLPSYSFGNPIYSAQEMMNGMANRPAPGMQTAQLNSALANPMQIGNGMMRANTSPQMPTTGQPFSANAGQAGGPDIFNMARTDPKVADVLDRYGWGFKNEQDSPFGADATQFLRNSALGNAGLGGAKLNETMRNDLARLGYQIPEGDEAIRNIDPTKPNWGMDEWETYVQPKDSFLSSTLSGLAPIAGVMGMAAGGGMLNNFLGGSGVVGDLGIIGSSTGGLGASTGGGLGGGWFGGGAAGGSGGGGFTAGVGETGLGSLPTSGTWMHTGVPTLGAGAGEWSLPASLSGISGATATGSGLTLGDALASANNVGDALGTFGTSYGPAGEPWSISDLINKLNNVKIPGGVGNLAKLGGLLGGGGAAAGAGSGGGGSGGGESIPSPQDGGLLFGGGDPRYQDLYGSPFSLNDPAYLARLRRF